MGLIQHFPFNLNLCNGQTSPTTFHRKMFSAIEYLPKSKWGTVDFDSNFRCLMGANRNNLHQIESNATKRY